MRTLLCCDDVGDEIVERLKRSLRTAGSASELVIVSYDQARGLGEQKSFDLAVVVLHGNPGNGYEAIQILREKAGGCVLAVGPIADSKVILRSLQAGAALFVDEDELDTEFEQALNRVFAKREGARPAGRLVAVVSASGGCGVSTLAVNLAAVLARELGKCGLIDLNSGRGDTPALLDLRPPFSLADLCHNEGRLDQALFEKMVTVHSSGVHLLAAPPAFHDVQALTPPAVRAALALARKLYPNTVIDLEDCVHAEQAETVRAATELLVVCRLNFTSLRHTRHLLDFLPKLDVPRERVKLVANQYGQPGELPVEEAEQALGESLTSFIPYDPKSINTANNTGTPAVLKFPTSLVANRISQLAGVGPRKLRSRSRLLEIMKLF